LETPHHLGRDRDAADVLDVAAGHRLAVSDDRERLQHRARIARRALRVDALEEFLERRLGLEAPAARRHDQLDPAVDPGFAELLEQQAQRVGVDLVVEHPSQLADLHPLLPPHPRRLGPDLYLIRTEHWRISRKWERRARTA